MVVTQANDWYRFKYTDETLITPTSEQLHFLVDSGDIVVFDRALMDTFCPEFFRNTDDTQRWRNYGLLFFKETFPL